MGVVSIREMFSPRGSDSSGISDTKVSRLFRVHTNNPNDDAVTIFASGLLPGILSPHPNNLFLLARRAQARQEAGAYWWVIEIEYSSIPNPQKLQDQQTFSNPLQRPARVSGGSDMQRRFPVKGYPVPAPAQGGNGQPLSYVSPILNSALDEYDSRPDIDDERLAVHFIKNYNPLPAWVLTYRNGTNNNDFVMYGQTYPRGTLKIANLRWSEFQEEQGIWYYEVQWDILYRPNLKDDPSQQGWYYTLPDRGYKYLTVSGDPTKKKDIRLSDDSLPRVPQLLNGVGGILTVDPTTVSQAAVYRTWLVTNEVDFSVLPPIPAPPNS